MVKATYGIFVPIATLEVPTAGTCTLFGSKRSWIVLTSSVPCVFPYRWCLQAMDRYFMTVPDKWTGFAMSNSVPNFEGVDLDRAPP